MGWEERDVCTYHDRSIHDETPSVRSLCCFGTLPPLPSPTLPDPTRAQLVLVMEFLPGGDLLQKLQKAKRPLEERVLRRIVRDVCSGMAFLHREAFVHGDLKSANVLFDAGGTAKVR